MLSIDKTVEVLDALRYCNKYMVGIDNDRVKHFYKIKHGMLAHMYRKPKSISGYRVKLDSIEIQHLGRQEIKLFSICVSNDTYRTYTFHVPMSNKNIKAFDPDYFFRWGSKSVIDELPVFPYESDGKEPGDVETWMRYYTMLKVIAYSWDVINASEEKLTSLQSILRSGRKIGHHLLRNLTKDSEINILLRTILITKENVKLFTSEQDVVYFICGNLRR